MAHDEVTVWRRGTSSVVTGPTTTKSLGVAKPRFVAFVLALYAAVQVILPLRPYLTNDEHPAWSCRGFNLSWQVMVAEKTGYVEFCAHDRFRGRRTRIETRDYITPRQALLMAQDPYLIRELARRISDDFEARGERSVEISVDAFATINGRPSQRIVDPKANLARQTGGGWILPLEL